jgi:hypothetical protein
MSVNVRVLCRFRPINDRERAEAASGKFKDSTFKLAFPDKCSVNVGNKGAAHSFNFDRVFDPSANQVLFLSFPLSSIISVVSFFSFLFSYPSHHPFFLHLYVSPPLPLLKQLQVYDESAKQSIQ